MPDPNFADKTIWTGDNLDILRGMNSECVDLICLFTLRPGINGLRKPQDWIAHGIRCNGLYKRRRFRAIEAERS